MSYNFRDRRPTRNTPETKYKNHSSYREFLKKDFYERCGYCDTPRYESMEDFHIDHFAPREKFKKTEWADKLNDYENLVYSCPHCNIQKSDKWPSNDFHLNVVGDEGFVCPCTDTYSSLFKRNSSGEILPQNKLGTFIYNELKLYLERFSIIWKMEKIRDNIEELAIYDGDPKMKSIRQEMALEYFDLLTQFRKFKGLSRV